MTAATPVNVLIVGDEASNPTVLEAALEPLGETLVRATSGREALRHLLDADFAGVLLDVRMPDMGGLEAARHIRALTRSKATPILFLTADGSD